MTQLHDPAAYAAQLNDKVARLRELLAPFAAPEPEVFDSPIEHYRLRAEFRLWREAGERHYAMFAAGDKFTPILIEQFPIASAAINAHLQDKARGSGEISYLASPVTGGGVTVGRFPQLFLLAMAQGKKQPADWAAFAWNILASQGQRIIKDGKDGYQVMPK